MKYPKTYHVPDSPNLQNDDRRIDSMDSLIGKNVIISEKLDGENTSLHNDKIHARSEENDNHASRDMVKSIWGSIRYMIPEHIQICGESMYACHSIFYDKLTNFFYVFAVIDKKREVFLSVSETREWCRKLGLEMAPSLFEGTWDGKFKMPNQSFYGNEVEGWVVRLVDEIPVNEWKDKAAKFVRAKHVTSDNHWKTNWKPNRLIQKI